MIVRRLLILIVALAAPAIAAPAAAPAAGDYSVWSCRDAAGNPLSTEAWVPFGNVANPAAHSDTCATNGWLGIQMIAPADYAGGSITGYALSAPSGTSIDSYRIEMAGQSSSPSGGTHFEVGLMIGGNPRVQNGNGCNQDLDPCSFGDVGAVWNAPANLFTASSLATGGLVFSATCTAPTGCVVGTAPIPYPAYGRLYRSQVVLTDPTAPAVGPIQGSVTQAGAIGGRRAVVADVTDVGGGVARTQLLVDGAVVAQVAGRGRCAEPYTAAAPCPDEQRAQFELDTAALGDGPHQLVVRAFDAAMNQADSPPVTITVDNRPDVVTVPAPGDPQTPRSPTGEQPPAPQQTPSTGAIAVKLPSRAALPRSSAVRGTVVGPDGSPRSGVRLRFERRPFGGDGDDWKTIGTATSGAGGAFALPPVRVSGQVRVVVVGDRKGRAATIGYVGRLKLSIKASDRRLSNGERITLRGRVRNDGGAEAGRDVLVQAIVRGRWRTIDSVEVDDDGRITWRYRFTNTTQTARYRFRFVLPRSKGLPWKRTVTEHVSAIVRAQ